MCKTIFLSVILAASTLEGASFTLGAAIQAGSAAANELFLGSTSGSASAAGSVSPYWTEGANHAFSLAFNALTNTATLSAQTGSGTTSLSWLVAGATAAPVARAWTIAAGGFDAVAANNAAVNTQARIRNLSISGPGFSTISPANLVANQNGGGTVSVSNGAPITFTTPGASGSWVLNGQIRFSGLATSFAGGASGNQLRMAFDILAVEEVPEPSTLLTLGFGLAALSLLRRS